MTGAISSPRQIGRWALMAALLAISSLAVFALLGSGERDRGRSAVPRQERREFSRAELRNFEILRGASSRPMPRPLRVSVVEALDASSAGMRFGRAVPVPVHGGRIWLIGGHRLTCLIEEEAKALACDAPDAVADNGLALGVFDPPRRAQGRPTDFAVVGVAPDAVKWVRVEINDVMQIIPVHRNVYSLSADNPITVDGFVRG